MIEIGPRIQLRISEDELSAHINILEIEPLQENKLSVEEEINKIKKHLKYGLKEEELARLLDSSIPDKNILIAEGKKAEDGIDGKIIYKFDINRPLTPKLKEDGSVDYKELDAFNNVQKNQILADIIAPTEGIEGMTVTGRKISAKNGRTPRLRYGRNVTLSEDESKLIATANGLVELKGKSITVSELLSLESVDSSTGNINFDGDIVLSKDLLNGFSVRATGNIEVKGAVEGGYIETKGDILVRQGIQGYNKKVINSEGNLSTKFIENSIINVDGNITSEAIMHSNVISNSNIILIGRKGLIVGGVCRARNEIAAKIVGSNMATATTLEVGVDPNIRLDHDNMKERLKSSKSHLKKVEQSLNILSTLEKNNGLTENKKELLDRLINTKKSLEEEIEVLDREVNVLYSQLRNLNKGKVKIADTIYPGVKIIIGDSYLIVKDEMKRCTFYRDGGDIRVGPY